MKIVFFNSFRLGSVLVILGLITTNCKKTAVDTPLPPQDWVTSLIGNYQVGQFSVDSLPTATVIQPVSTTVLIERNGNSLDQCNLTTAYSFSYATTPHSIGQTVRGQRKTLSIQKKPASFDLVDNGQYVGSWQNDTLTLTNYRLVGERITLKAVRR